MRKLLMGVCLLLAACSNPSTPAGHVGYVQKGAWIGSARFYGLQTGPTSSGLGWLLSVANVPITPVTFSEDFQNDAAILSKDNLMISFNVHTVMRVRADQVKELVERFSFDPSNAMGTAYAHFLKEPIRTFARDELQRYESFAIKDNIEHISREIRERTIALAKETPFDIITVVVGNIQYPKEVADAVSRKMAAAQLLEQQDTQLKIKQKEAEQRVAEAKGIAESMRIIQAQLTAEYLQHEAIESQRAMVGSPNHSTIYIPVGPMGVPLTGTFKADGHQP